MRGHARAARYAAPAAFLLAATIAILIIRSGLSSDETLPVTTAPVTATTTGEKPPETTTASTTTAASGAEYYEIQRGDTLAVVADEFDTTVERLLVLNPDIDPVALTIGQQIRVK